MGTVRLPKIPVLTIDDFVSGQNVAALSAARRAEITRSCVDTVPLMFGAGVGDTPALPPRPHPARICAQLKELSTEHK